MEYVPPKRHLISTSLHHVNIQHKRAIHLLRRENLTVWLTYTNRQRNIVLLSFHVHTSYATPTAW